MNRRPLDCVHLKCSHRGAFSLLNTCCVRVPCRWESVGRVRVTRECREIQRRGELSLHPRAKQKNSGRGGEKCANMNVLPIPHGRVVTTSTSPQATQSTQPGNTGGTTVDCLYRYKSGWAGLADRSRLYIRASTYYVLRTCVVYVRSKTCRRQVASRQSLTTLALTASGIRREVASSIVSAGATAASAYDNNPASLAVGNQDYGVLCILLFNKNLISLSHSKHTHSPRNAHSASAEGTDPV